MKPRNRQSLALFSLATLVAACGAQAPASEEVGKASAPVVFGADDRLEYGGVSDPLWLRYASATAALFDTALVSCGGGTCALTTSAFATSRHTGPSDTSDPLCTAAPYRNQAQGAFCTAFLVGPNQFATAGHCFLEAGVPGCANTRVVFGFTASADGSVVQTNIPQANVYTCIDAHPVLSGAEDWAIFTVDRPVAGRMPMIARYDGVAQSNHTFLVAGHPDGLPLKLQGNAALMDNTQVLWFGSSADAFAGNSGSPLIDLNTGIVDGIHVRRPTFHYTEQDDGLGGKCAMPTVCDEATGCSPNFGESAWAVETRMTRAVNQTHLGLHSALFNVML
ncbi:MAG TPA: trypsin-like peptidase domain-containing protein [Polyangiaceae bacterium]|nr:trypsin-like peptidase domain-containing protein [Polyangiaceae bacterium]